LPFSRSWSSRVRPRSPRASTGSQPRPNSKGRSSRALAAIRERLAESATKAFLVVRNDRLVYQWYSPDHSPAKTHYTASMAKAIVGGMSVAVALTDGRLTLEDRVATYVPQWAADPRKSRITIRHLGSHTSGLDDAEADKLPHEKLTGWGCRGFATRRHTAIGHTIGALEGLSQ
jgi:CubicO group peptidase (beta-lactamase class C family)